MKEIIARLFACVIFMLLLVAGCGGGSDPAAPTASPPAGTGAAPGAVVLVDSCYGSGATDLGNLDDYYYIGNTYTPADSLKITEVHVRVMNKEDSPPLIRNISTKQFIVRFWTLAGDNLGAEIAASNPVSGKNTWGPPDDLDHWETFTFAASVPLAKGVTYAMTINMEGAVDDKNFAEVSYGLNAYSGKHARWRSDKTLADSNDLHDWVMEMYGMHQ